MIDEAEKHRRIWWMDRSLSAVLILGHAALIHYGSFSRLSRFVFTSQESLWVLPLSGFVYLMVVLSSFIAMGVLLDRLFQTGRTIDFITLFKFLVIASTVITIAGTLLVFA